MFIESSAVIHIYFKKIFHKIPINRIYNSRNSSFARNDKSVVVTITKARRCMHIRSFNNRSYTKEAKEYSSSTKKKVLQLLLISHCMLIKGWSLIHSKNRCPSYTCLSQQQSQSPRVFLILKLVVFVFYTYIYVRISFAYSLWLSLLLARGFYQKYAPERKHREQWLIVISLRIYLVHNNEEEE